MNFAQKYDLFFPFFIKVVNKSKAYSFLIMGMLHLQKMLLSVIMLRFHFVTAKEGTWVHKYDRGPLQNKPRCCQPPGHYLCTPEQRAQRKDRGENEVFRTIYLPAGVQRHNLYTTQKQSKVRICIEIIFNTAIIRQRRFAVKRKKKTMTSDDMWLST